ncbi:MAG TPA: type I-C CRISPR-associated endonuclease Cas1c [Leptospiraceae bacterium]|nr:type I-C CRISPR-associated endonuclease Cas1c [Leptospiraceae bacterium]
MAEVKLNILYITQEGLYLHHELEKIKVERKQETIMELPIHHLQGITIFGICSISPSLLQKCLERGIFVSYLTARGKFMGRLEGANSGNVLLRKAQFKKSEMDAEKLKIAKSIIAGKIQNSRLNLLRSARDLKDETKEKEIRNVVLDLERNLTSLEQASSVESARGYEGNSAKSYFSVFDHCIVQQKKDFEFTKRMKRPPKSRINALLSFTYSLLSNDCISACQAVGLDPFIGFLHEERPGRPSLALDLMEEFRPFADRFVLTLINRKQIQASDIIEKTGSVYTLTNDGRKALLTAYHNRKQEEVTHYLLEQKCRIGELFLLQARILARSIRGEMPLYAPYIWR